MLQECLLAYYNARCQNLEEAFFKAAGYFDPEGLHDVRVEIKQLRAFFRLLGRLTPTFKSKKYLRPFRALFKAGGDLRDVHVQQELVRTWSQERGEFMSAYYNSLKQKEFPARTTFANFTRDFELEKEIALNRKRISHSLRGLSQQELRERIQQRMDAKTAKIISLGEQALADESRLHTLRILSKETRYTLDIAKRCLPESAYWNAMNDRLRAIHHSLGKWHDGDVAREHILQFQQESSTSDESEGIPQTDPAIYQQLLQNMQAEKAIHLQAFHTAWAEFLALLQQEKERMTST